jgi:hypothetical protein
LMDAGKKMEGRISSPPFLVTTRSGERAVSLPYQPQ